MLYDCHTKRSWHSARRVLRCAACGAALLRVRGALRRMQARTPVSRLLLPHAYKMSIFQALLPRVCCRGDARRLRAIRRRA